MNLKHFLNLLLILPLVTILVACNSDETRTVTGISEDAQIYGIKLSAIPVTKADTIAFAQLEKTIFAIDQINGYIYNPQPLPFDIDLTKKFHTEITFSKYGTPGIVRVAYTDSVGLWNRKDSISYKDITGFEIRTQEQNGGASMEYIFDLRRYTIDPDTILWEQLQKTTENIKEQKAVIKEKEIYCFFPYNNKVYVSKVDRDIPVLDAKVETTLPGNTITESITVFNNTFYAISESGNSYSSTDAKTWTDLGNHNLHSVVGIVPGITNADDILLTILNPSASGSNNRYTFASTKNMSDFAAAPVKGNNAANQSAVALNFPSKGFTWVSESEKSKHLTMVAGSDFTGTKINTTWHVKGNATQLELIPANIVTNKIFTAKEGVATFMYDKKLYAMNDSVFAISDNMGSKWAVAPRKQALSPDMPSATGQSIVVDHENYIWVFGGVPNTPMEIYRGRLNKLIPKN